MRASEKPGMSGRYGGQTEFGVSWGEPDTLNGRGSKPKEMHWSTFERLTAQHDAFVQVSLSGMAARLNLIGESLDDRV
jgi:hypothetical protein